MTSSSSADVRRCRPLLGTFVEIAATHAGTRQAHRAVDAAFDEVLLVHRRMSFHDPDSDVSRLNREALDRAVAVHPETVEVLRWAGTRPAARMSSRSSSRFERCFAPADETTFSSSITEPRSSAP